MGLDPLTTGYTPNVMTIQVTLDLYIRMFYLGLGCIRRSDEMALL